MIICKTKKWGNSIGILIPNKEVKNLNLKEDQEIVVDIIKKENPLKELFGSMKFSKPTRKILEESRKEMESKWL